MDGVEASGKTVEEAHRDSRSMSWTQSATKSEVEVLTKAQSRYLGVGARDADDEADEDEWKTRRRSDAGEDSDEEDSDEEA